MRICEQHGFIPGRITIDAMFTLRVLMEKHRKSQELHCVFVNLEEKLMIMYRKRNKCYTVLRLRSLV